jgi:hypothetical protein
MDIQRLKMDKEDKPAFLVVFLMYGAIGVLAYLLLN